MFVTENEWLQPCIRKKKKDNQKKALVEALQKPMTGTELLTAMRPKCPSVQLRDIWRLLKNMGQRQLTYCLTPGEVTGRMYFFTEKGRRYARQTFKVSVSPLPRLVNWKKYSQVVRGRARKAVLIEMGKPWKGELTKTITTVRKLLAGEHPLTLGAAMRAMHELEALNLINCVGVSRERSRPLFQLTTGGKRIVNQLKWKPENEQAVPNASPSNLFKEPALLLDNEKENEIEYQGALYRDY